MSVAEAVIGHLDVLGVDTVFGIPGGNISAFIQALRRHPRLRFVIASHEGGAAFMADGYARSSGRLGVCLTTAGPGATNAVTGVASAHLDQVPLLVITGQVATDRFGLGAIQESTDTGGVHTVELYRHATAYSVSVPDERAFRRIFARALNIARGPRGAAVHLSIPTNVARAPLDSDLGWLPTADSRGTAGVDSGLVEAGLAALRGAQRPLLFLGGGARQALASHYDVFERFVSQHGIPVVTSLRGKGLFSEYHPLCLGVLGMAGSTRAAEYLQAGVDVLMVVGSRLGEWATRGFGEYFLSVKQTVHVDIDPGVFDAFLPAHLPIVGDAGSVLSLMCELAEKAPAPDVTRAALPPEVRRIPAPRAPAESPSADLKPQHVMEELNPFLRDNVDIYVDMGNCTAWATHCLQLEPPARMFYPCGLSSMGWSCGAVIGGKIACPERTAIALVGDGSFLMNGTEIHTAAKYGVGAIFVVFNDGYLGMVNHGEYAQSAGEYPLTDSYYRLGNLDLVGFAESLGARAHLVDRPGQLYAVWPSIVARADAERRPQVVVARIDFREVPPYGERFASVAGDSV